LCGPVVAGLTGVLSGVWEATVAHIGGFFLVVNDSGVV